MTILGFNGLKTVINRGILYLHVVISIFSLFHLAKLHTAQQAILLYKVCEHGDLSTCNAHFTVKWKFIDRGLIGNKILCIILHACTEQGTPLMRNPQDCGEQSLLLLCRASPPFKAPGHRKSAFISATCIQRTAKEASISHTRSSSGCFLS